MTRSTLVGMRSRHGRLRFPIVSRRCPDTECSASSSPLQLSSTRAVTSTAHMWPGMLTLCWRMRSSRESSASDVLSSPDASQSLNLLTSAPTSRRKASGSVHVCCGEKRSVASAMLQPSMCVQPSNSCSIRSLSSSSSPVAMPTSSSTICSSPGALPKSWRPGSDRPRVRATVCIHCPAITSGRLSVSGAVRTRMLPGCRSECR
mmetsp:Transcript_44309/g.113129  ORF Transcript_44309/g.113129 Transcript_44309/m.113129 type:complete len:204 (+) Transcript_44309:382-993(+)